MPLKLTCPTCRAAIPLDEPFPMPGGAVKCAQCGSSMAVSYPDGAYQRLVNKGKRFTEGPSKAPKSPFGAAPIPDPSASRSDQDYPAARPPRAPPPRHLAEDPPSQASTTVDATKVDHTVVAEDEEVPDTTRTIPSMRNPHGALPNNASESDLPADWDPPVTPKKAPPKTAPKKKRRGWLGMLAGLFGGGAGGVLLLAGLGFGGAAAAGAGGYWYYSQDLPSIEKLQAYRPATVTVVLDKNGETLGEIYEQRRYVVPLDKIPKHVQNAFISAEDSGFWSHGGVDFGGLSRAILRNLAEGRMAQGASTITQQVTRNFLLTKDKKIERKIKEILLSWRIEDAYTKEHILFLYLNEIYLGSQSYGVEAASRTFFGKHVEDITVAEAAILAGLPQRPSDYSPHRSWKKAKARQGYVLEQMVQNGYLTEAERQAAVAEEIKVAPKRNAFLEEAPYFTEAARRYVVEKYGEEKVLSDGLTVKTTCDLSLQRAAQKAITTGVHRVDQRMGFRRIPLAQIAEKRGDKTEAADEDTDDVVLNSVDRLPKGTPGVLKHLTSDEAIANQRKKDEADMISTAAYNLDPAGRAPPPTRSEPVAGEIYQAVILEVQKTWVRIGVGDHEGIIPLAWTTWAYEVNPRKNWRTRAQNDLTSDVDSDGDGKNDGAILQKGDVVLVKVEGLDSTAVEKVFKDTPGEKAPKLALKLWQIPEVEAALFSMDLKDGAVRAMVGGSDFKRSQFNRATQARRQVGSTFKPLVYTAAIGTKKITTASIVVDGPLAFATNNEFVWKPGNYGADYEGNMSLRAALAASKNTCTVRVLEAVDPGMNQDIVYNFARAVGIGGPPTHTLPEDWVKKPENDILCPWTEETKDSTICMDRFPAKDPDLSNTAHRAQIKPEDNYQCRACDFSMGLGSASLTMDELVRAYSVFGADGRLVEPYYVDEVKDRDGNILESHEAKEFAQVIDPPLASIGLWLIEQVAATGTGYPAKQATDLIGIAGKTGTTQEEKDTWFIGLTPDVVTAVWVGYDDPRSMGVNSTGGLTSVPIWSEFMKVAAPKSKDRPFKWHPDLEWANIDEKSGRRVESGGRRFPFLKDTVPESSGVAAGQVSIEDLTGL